MQPRVPRETKNNLALRRAALWVLGLAQVLLVCANRAAFPLSPPDNLWQAGAFFGWPGGGVFFTNGLAFSPDGSLLAWQLDQARTQLSVASNGAPVRVFSGWGTPSFSPDGNRLALRGTNAVNLWRLADGGLDLAIPVGENEMSLVAFSPDGTLVAIGQTRSNDRLYVSSVGIWRTSDGTLMRSLAFDAGEFSFAFSPDSKFMATGGWDFAYLYRISDGALLQDFLSDGGLGVTALAFSPDGSMLALGEAGYQGFLASIGYLPACLKLFSVADGRNITTFDLPANVTNAQSGITSLAFSADGRELISGAADFTLRFWRVPEGRLLRRYVTSPTSGYFAAVAISPDGRRYAYGQSYYSRGNPYDVPDRGTVAVARVPTWITGFSATGESGILEWSGGRSLYQVQEATKLAGDWVTVATVTNAVTSANSAALRLTNPTAFFRVVSPTNTP